MMMDSIFLLREGFDKDQPGCSAGKFWDHNFFDLAESTTYGDQLGGGLWVGGSPGPPGQGGKVSGGHKGPFVANLQIASSRPIFIQMSSNWAQKLSPGLNYLNLVKKFGKYFLGLLQPPKGVFASLELCPHWDPGFPKILDIFQ